LLASLDASPAKFSGCKQLSLKEIVFSLKKRICDGGGSVELVFAWHGVFDYWFGVDEASFHDAKTYFSKFSK